MTIVKVLIVYVSNKFELSSFIHSKWMKMAEILNPSPKSLSETNYDGRIILVCVIYIFIVMLLLQASIIRLQFIL